MSNHIGIGRHLALSTISFALCFAMWGLVGAFGPVFRELFHLSSTQTAFVVVVPVLLGSLARLPMGMLTDRFGGRIVFTILMVPFNRGMLCPKGVKRYLQSSHPDRLLAPLLRDASGFRPVPWSDALSFTATRLRQIQERHGRDAVAVFGGASL